MGIVALDITGENKDLIAKLMQLEKRTETLEAKLKGMGEGGSRSVKGLSRELSGAAKEALMFTAGLLGVGSVQAVIGKVIEEARKASQELRKMNEAAFNSQLSWEAAKGLFLNNNQSLAKGNAAAPWFAFAQEQAKKVPAVGAPGVLRALGEARSALAGTPEEDLKGAFTEAVKMAQLNPDTDIKAMTEATVRIKAGQGGSIVQATNFVNAFAEISGADISKTAKELPKLQALSSLGRGGVVDAAALHGFLTSAVPDATGEQTTTTVTNLLSRVATREVDMPGGKRMKFQSKDSLDRLMESAQRIGSGEFGDKAEAIAAFTASLGRESASATLAISAIADKLPQLKGAVEAIRKGWESQTSSTDEMLAAKSRLTPGSGAIQGVKTGKALEEAANLKDVTGMAEASAETELASFDKAHGTGEAWDFTRGLRRVLAENGRITPVEYTEQEMRARVLSDIVPRITRGRGGPGGLRDVVRAGSIDEMLDAGARGGAIDTRTGLDRMEQRMLEAAGVSADRIESLQGKWVSGMKDAFKEGLSELIMELRQSKTSPRQELD